MSVNVMCSMPKSMSRVNVLSVVNTLSMINSFTGRISILLLFPAVSVMAPLLIEIIVLSIPVAISSLTFRVIRSLAFNLITKTLAVSPLIALPGDRLIVTFDRLREL